MHISYTTTSSSYHLFRFVVIALLGTAFLVGWAQIRKVTYPRDFIYLEPQQIRGEMARLSMYMRQIDAITDHLGAGQILTNHFVIDHHIDGFKRDVNLAIVNASADPPNYYALGQLRRLS